MAARKTKMTVGKKIMITLILMLLMLAAVGCGLGTWYFTDHFLPGTTINGFHCSFMTVKEAENLLNKKVGAYVLTVETMNNGIESITADQAGLSYVSDGSVEDFLKGQDHYRWFLSLAQEHTYETKTAVIYDEDKFTAAIEGLKCMQPENVTEPEDAHLEDNGQEFVIVPETEGNALDEQKVRALISEALITGQTSVNLEEAGCYLKPSIYRDDERIVKGCEWANEVIEVIITYDFANRTETVDQELIRTWITQDESGEYTLDEDLIADYVAELAAKYDTFGDTRTFRTYDGRQITLTGGDYGWVIDQLAETQALKEAILSEVTQVREPIYAYSAQSRANNDIGYTYIEIDLTNQRMVFYQNGNPVVDTKIVSGSPLNTDTATPTGFFSVEDMQSPMTVSCDGGQVNVSYWISFYGDLGIHDSTWRTEYGGGIYFTNGSDGCVNAPYDKVQAIYNSVEIGTPVIVYQ
jgi:lipoprotein-anchoring transpeptidase ErfK/SrfK